MHAVFEAMMNIDLLFRYYYRPLCLYALHYINNVDTVEDIVQDSFVRLLQQGDVVNERAWLYATVRNACISHLRQASTQVVTIAPSDLDGTITDEEAQERSLHEAELWTAIDTLPERCREVFLLSKRDGKKYREIADLLHISEKTVEHQISKALRILRGKVEDFFYSFFSFNFV